MAETVKKRKPHHKEVVGEVVSNKMAKTIVVKVIRKKAHPFYGRVVSKAKKFYAHDEKNEAHLGDVVRLEETRPLSKLNAGSWRKLCAAARWRLKCRQRSHCVSCRNGRYCSHGRDDEIDARGRRQLRRPQAADDSAARAVPPA